jgi:dihydroxyacetone kinase
VRSASQSRTGRVSLKEGFDYYDAQMKFGINMNYNARQEIIGDDVNNIADRNYGNNEVKIMMRVMVHTLQELSPTDVILWVYWALLTT